MANIENALIEIIGVLNTNKNCQQAMEELYNKAKEMNMTNEEWENFKQQLLVNLFLNLYAKDKDIQELVMKDMQAVLESKGGKENA